MTTRIVAAIAALASSAPAFAQNLNVFAETAIVDLSDDRTAPTLMGFVPGYATVTASQQGGALGRDIDYFTIQVPMGAVLSEIVVENYLANPATNAAFIGIEAGAQIQSDPNIPSPALLLGGTIYGTNDIGGDILPRMGNLSGAMGFTPPLAAGTYSFWLNQTGGPSTVTLRLLIEPLGLGVEYCSAATANSTGVPGRLEGLGSVSLAANNFQVRAFDLPQSAFGYLLTSETPAITATGPTAASFLCIGGAIGRFVGQVSNTGSTGDFITNVNLNALPQPTGPALVLSSDVWYFQAWHRDSVGGQATSNLTRGLAVRFQP